MMERMSIRLFVVYYIPLPVGTRVDFRSSIHRAFHGAAKPDTVPVPILRP